MLVGLFISHWFEALQQLSFSFMENCDASLQQIGSWLAILHIILNYFGEIGWNFHLLSFYPFSLAVRDIVMIFESEASLMKKVDADFYFLLLLNLIFEWPFRLFKWYMTRSEIGLLCYLFMGEEVIFQCHQTLIAYIANEC